MVSDSSKKAGRALKPVGDGEEAHPAFGLITVNRTQHSPPGKVLFDSDVRHQHYIVLKIQGATLKRELGRDWVYGDSRPIVEVAFSMSQWAGLLASMNTTGVPCTLTYTLQEGYIPDVPQSSRLAVSHKETREAADKAVVSLVEALEAYEAHKTAHNLRALRAQIVNLPSNLSYAAKVLTEHAESVVNHARADVEAMVDERARELGLDPVQLGIAKQKMIEGGEPDAGI